MNFAIEDSPEQSAFRAEVREFLKTAVSPNLEHSVDPVDMSYEQYQLRRDLGRKLGAKGWLYPSMPKEYGGGDLSAEKVAILYDELSRIGLALPPYYDAGGRMAAPTILVWGTRGAQEALPAADLPRRSAHVAAADRAERGLRSRGHQDDRDPRRRRLRRQRPEDLRRQLARRRLLVDDRRHRSQRRAPQEPLVADDPDEPAGHHGAADGSARDRRRGRQRLGREERGVLRQRARARGSPRRRREQRLESRDDAPRSRARRHGTARRSPRDLRIHRSLPRAPRRLRHRRRSRGARASWSSSTSKPRSRGSSRCATTGSRTPTSRARTKARNTACGASSRGSTWRRRCCASRGRAC